jgi:hypothetical protein
MDDEREINYEDLVQTAMRGVVRVVLTRVAKTGLPGEHDFYIAFRTNAAGVSISPRLKEKYPEEMTVVLQHRFWDLIVSDTRFEVKLTFDSIPERLSIPFDAIKVFFDPSVPYGLQFEDLDAAESKDSAPQAPAQRVEAPRPKTAKVGDTEDGRPRAERKPRAARKPQAEKTGERATGTGAGKAPSPAPALVKPSEPASDKGPKVVSIDAFRKK